MNRVPIASLRCGDRVRVTPNGPSYEVAGRHTGTTGGHVVSLRDRDGWVTSTAYHADGVLYLEAGAEGS